MSLLLHSLVAEFAARRAGGASMSRLVGAASRLVSTLNSCSNSTPPSIVRPRSLFPSTAHHRMGWHDLHASSVQLRREVARLGLAIPHGEGCTAEGCSNAPQRREKEEAKGGWVHEKLLPRAAQALLSIQSFRRGSHRCGPANTNQQQADLFHSSVRRLTVLVTLQVEALPHGTSQEVCGV